MNRVADLEMIDLKTSSQLERMRRAGRIVSQVLEVLRRSVRPGMCTRDLDRIAEEEIQRRGGQAAFKGYRGFPATLCASVNEEVVHGIPSERKLEEGDIIGLDLGAVMEGYYADAAITVPVGTVSKEVQELLSVTERSLRLGIEQARAGHSLTDISHAVQQEAEQHGYSVVREFVGHGIGAQLHEPPQVPNFGRPGFGPTLKAGMMLAIEPMVNMGLPAVRILRDGWTAVTQDGSWSAHFEHTVAITEGSPEILTKHA